MMQDNDKIERNIAQQRAHMAAALTELRGRVNARHLTSVAMRSATPVLTGAAPMVARMAMRKPVGSAMFSAGLAYLLFGHERDLETTVRRLTHKVGEQGRSLGQASSGLLDKLQSVAASTGAAAQETVRNVTNTVSDSVASVLRPAPKPAVQPYASVRPITSSAVRARRSFEWGALAFAAAFAVGMVLVPSEKTGRETVQPRVV